MSDLVKSLTELIDETLAEIETLKKGRFDAEEIELGDNKANGEMVAKKEDEEKDEEKVEEKEEEKAEKAEDKEEEKEDEEDEMEKAEQECAKAEEAFKAACAKRDAMKKGVLEEKEEIKKSIDARIQPIEARLEEITSLVKKLADSPVPARGSTFKSIQPLAKSEESQPLTKSKVLDELVTLKKSGKPVASEDVFRAELGGLSDLEEIATKYGIK
jgi:small-conductance mechanosensitive channel